MDGLLSRGCTSVGRGSREVGVEEWLGWVVGERSIEQMLLVLSRRPVLEAIPELGHDMEQRFVERNQESQI
jgi:hypothetical protein